MSVEARVNKMLLPTREGAKHSTTTRSIHQGRHAGDVKKALETRMNDILEEGATKGFTPQQYRQRLVRVIQGEKRVLKRGDRALNAAKREWAT